MSADGRTKPLYPTYGPEDGTGRDWAAYFRDIKEPYREAARAAIAAQEAQEPAERPELIEPPRYLTPEEIAALPSRGTPAQVVKRLNPQGWDVRVQQSVVHMPPVRYATGSDEGAEVEYAVGDVRYPDYFLLTTAIGAVKRDAAGRIGLAMFATWSDKNGFEIAETYDPLDGREIRVGFMKGRKPNLIEIEENIAPPLGLKEWLVDFAPTAADKKAAAKKAEAAAQLAAEAEASPMGIASTWEAA